MLSRYPDPIIQPFVRELAVLIVLAIVTLAAVGAISNGHGATMADGFSPAQAAMLHSPSNPLPYGQGPTQTDAFTAFNQQAIKAIGDAAARAASAVTP